MRSNFAGFRSPPPGARLKFGSSGGTPDGLEHKPAGSPTRGPRLQGTTRSSPEHTPISLPCDWSDPIGTCSRRLERDMSSPQPDGNIDHVRFFRAPDDNRTVAIFIGGRFNAFDRFPPFMETPEEIRHVQEAYKVADPTLERTTKAHVTDNGWPLQIIMLERHPGATTLPHYHVPNEALPPLPTRHQILICQSGRARVGIFTTSGAALGDVYLEPNDLLLMAEGHEVEFLEPRTRLIEIKQGPFPGTDADDKVDLPRVAR